MDVPWLCLILWLLMPCRRLRYIPLVELIPPLPKTYISPHPVSIGSYCTLLPEIGPGQVDELIAPAGHDGFQHVKSKALSHVGRDAGWNRKDHSAHDRVDENRSVMGERSAMPVSTSPGSSSLIPRTPMDSAMAAKFGFLSCAMSRNTKDFCSISMKPREPLLKTTTLTGNRVAREGESHPSAL